MHDLKNGKIKEINRSLLIAKSNVESVDVSHFKNQQAIVTSPPQLSFVINDFLNRYDQDHRAMFTKLSATLPLLLELITDKPINQIFQTDLNNWFDEIQNLPVRRDAKIFKGMSTKQMIETIKG